MILGTGLWMLPRSVRPDGSHRRLDGWWQAALLHGGVTLWMIGRIWDHHAWVGMIIWLFGVFVMIPVFWIRSRAKTFA